LSDVLTLTVPAMPAVDQGRKASVLRAGRAVLVPALPDLGQSVLPDPTAQRTAPVLPGDEGADAGYLAGHAQGLAEGRALAAAEADAERAALVHARIAAEQLVAELGAAVEEARRQRALALDGLATELAEAAVSLATAVVGRETVTGADALTRALALAPAKAAATARLHPDDLVTIDAAEHPAVTLQADPTVERGGCVLDLPDATIDAQLGPALERARAALVGDSEVAW
jgi:flagellar assembly protein FliH